MFLWILYQIPKNKIPKGQNFKFALLGLLSNFGILYTSGFCSFGISSNSGFGYILDFDPCGDFVRKRVFTARKTQGTYQTQLKTEIL